MKIVQHPPSERILALDLSLTHTGVVGLMYDLIRDRYDVMLRKTIKTPARAKGESDPSWNRRRLNILVEGVMSSVRLLEPHHLVVEVTKHAYPKRKTKDGGVRTTTRGEEYNAGYGLGRAIGWLDAICAVHKLTYEEMDAGLIKLRIAGSRTASKEAAWDGLVTWAGYNLDGWTEHEKDALACGIAWVRQREGDEKEAWARELATRGSHE